MTFLALRPSGLFYHSTNCWRLIIARSFTHSPVVPHRVHLLEYLSADVADGVVDGGGHHLGGLATVSTFVDQQVVLLLEGPLAELALERRADTDRGGRSHCACLPPRHRPRLRVQRVHRKHPRTSKKQKEKWPPEIRVHTRNHAQLAATKWYLATGAPPSYELMETAELKLEARRGEVGAGEERGPHQVCVLYGTCLRTHRGSAEHTHASKHTKNSLFFLVVFFFIIALVRGKCTVASGATQAAQAPPTFYPRRGLIGRPRDARR